MDVGDIGQLSWVKLTPLNEWDFIILLEFRVFGLQTKWERKADDFGRIIDEITDFEWFTGIFKSDFFCTLQVDPNSWDWALFDKHFARISSNASEYWDNLACSWRILDS